MPLVLITRAQLAQIRTLKKEIRQFFSNEPKLYLGKSQETPKAIYANFELPKRGIVYEISHTGTVLYVNQSIL